MRLPFVALLCMICACAAPPDVGILECDPHAPAPAPECIPDAGGADASDDAAPDGPTATCGGSCVPAPSENAGYWSSDLVALRVSSADDIQDCPDELPNEAFRLYAMLEAPPAACDACTCGPSVGVCPELPAGLPSSMTIDNAPCGQTGSISLPFDGPAGWDGSCTSTNALPAGEMCPAGSSTLCAQSVRVSKLPGPVKESCPPTSESPSFTAQAPTWKLGAIACTGVMETTSCRSPSKLCVADPGPGWLHCVYGLGNAVEECPKNYIYKYELYPKEAFVDNRGCGACVCGPPEGSGCLGTLRLYDDAACSSEFNKQAVGSYEEQCGNFIPPGRAIAGHAITDISYVTGSCGATGGEPMGQAVADAASVVTFCCLGPFWDIY